jgi:hypothetical protein
MESQMANCTQSAGNGAMSGNVAALPGIQDPAQGEATLAHVPPGVAEVVCSMLTRSLAISEAAAAYVELYRGVELEHDLIEALFEMCTSEAMGARRELRNAMRRVGAPE